MSVASIFISSKKKKIKHIPWKRNKWRVRLGSPDTNGTLDRKKRLFFTRRYNTPVAGGKKKKRNPVKLGTSSVAPMGRADIDIVNSDTRRYKQDNKVLICVNGFEYVEMLLTGKKEIDSVKKLEGLKVQHCRRHSKSSHLFVSFVSFVILGFTFRSFRFHAGADDRKRRASTAAHFFVLFLRFFGQFSHFFSIPCFSLLFLFLHHTHALGTFFIFK